MKKSLCLFLILILIPSVCLAEANSALYTIWGIDIGMSAYDAAAAAQKSTGFDVMPLPSPDEKEVAFFYAKLGENSSLLGVKLENIFIYPEGRPIPANDTTAAWEKISIIFDTTAAASSYGTLYDELCASYGEPDSATFTTNGLGLTGTTPTDQTFPVFSDGFSAAVVQVAIDGGLEVSLNSRWKNITLTLVPDDGELFLYLEVYASESGLIFY